ncbi:MAG TPA: hypothetical protein VK631_11080, partial [Solirubrobacteraceae bacterium]|nr:hypothetical protein [Solirubrobacteraceae bacterium]
MDEILAPPAIDQGFDTMSLATIDTFRPSAAPVRTTPTPASTPAPSESRPAIRAVPEGTEARGFALYIGIDEQKARDAG